jgi:CRP-like cAMP-binding protein
LDEVAFRLAQRLVDAADAFGVEGDAGVMLAKRLSQSELALMVGTARQTVNKMLQQFQDKGLVAIRNGAITITDLTRLRKAAEKGSRLRKFAA